MTVKLLICLLILLFLKNLQMISCKYEQQPQILTYEGELIIKPARDKNIILRLSNDATLSINDKDALRSIRERYRKLKQSGDKEIAVIEPTDSLSNQINIIKQEILSLKELIANLEQSTTRRGFTRRVNFSLNKLIENLSAIEKNLGRNECEANHDNNNEGPCKNGAICIDGYKDFSCECLIGWKGKTCEVDIDECHEIKVSNRLDCQNSGVCINTLGSYRCVCRNGFSGTHCTLRSSICDSHVNSFQICGHGTCVSAINSHNFTCICDNGWSKDIESEACIVDIDECSGNKNNCHSTCINLPGSYRCGLCPVGYTGNGILCVDINECDYNNGGCSLQPEVRCINTEGSHLCGDCPVGYIGDGKTCEPAPSNLCDNFNVCHPSAKCEYISGSVVCSCPYGMFGHGFGQNGCATEEIENPCENHECKNNGTCITVGHGTRCICADGYSGPSCEEADACHPNPCENEATCRIIFNDKYRCTCKRGTTGVNCEIQRHMCGTIIRQPSGELAYPPQGEMYESNERCAFIIRTSDRQILNVTFSKFDVEYDDECNKDFLQIHDGRSIAAQLIGRFCGDKLPLGGNVLSSHQQIFLWFRSDNETNKSGWELNWTSQKQICGETLNLKESSNGIIRSPGYPGKSPINRDCEWHLNAPYNYRLSFRIYDVNLGGASNCTRDTIKIFDTDVIVKSICETTLPPPIYTSSNIARVHFHTDSFNVDSSFQLHYEVISGEPHCGGMFTESTGIISAYGHMTSTVCMYLIKQPQGLKIQLQIQKLNMLSTQIANKCIFSNIEIFDGDNSDDTPLLHLCGERIPSELITSSKNIILIKYENKFRMSSTDTVFEISYQRVCENTFVESYEGEFSTPNYPKSYYDDLTCTYDIYGPINHRVQLNITDFSITSAESEINKTVDDDSNENNDGAQELAEDLNYVDIYLSRTNKRRYYKGAPMFLISENNKVSIVFHSGKNTDHARGLHVKYSFEEEVCGGVFTENDDLSYNHLTSTDFCEWIIESTEGKSIALELFFNRYDEECSDNKKELFIFDNSTENYGQLLYSFCGQVFINETFHTNFLTVLFKKQINDNGSSVHLSYKFLEDKSNCGGTYKANFGVIKSPGWPKQYLANQNCTWIINAALGNQIELVVKNFSLEGTSNRCFSDYLEIRNGENSDSPLIGRYCGTSIPSKMPSFSNNLYVHFHSDYLISATGFFITWQQTDTGCGGKLYSFKGSIHSPSDPGAITCFWQILVSEGSTIDLNVTAIGDYVDLCRQNVLNIYDGDSTASQLLKFSNCSSIIRIKSKSNQVFLHYVVEDGQQFFSQFLIDYVTNCVVKIEKLQGIIESPNFPDNYPPNLECVWDIKGGRNNQYLLAISHLKVEDSCEFDYLEIHDMLNTAELKNTVLCNKPNDIIKSTGNRIVIKFKSDYLHEASGFRIEYKRLGCGTHLTELNADITSPMPYCNNCDCEWYIEVPAGKRIVLTIPELYIDTETHNCDKDALIIKEEKNSNITLLHECHGENVALSLTSPANQLYINFKTSDENTRKYFKGYYSTDEAKCGGLLSNNYGVITSPNYPYENTTNIECVWKIQTDHTYQIKIQIVDINMKQSNNCEDAFLKIINGDNISTTRYCASNEKTTFSYDKITVILKISTNGWGNFKLRYERTCSDALLHQEVGMIKSRFFETCSWEVFPTLDQKSEVYLHIIQLDCNCLSNCTSGLWLWRDNNRNEKICNNKTTDINLYQRNIMRIEAKNINFVAKYSKVEIACGGILTLLRGIFVSPKHPEPYPGNIECVWQIKATQGNSIEINVLYLDIMVSDRCNIDYLEIRNGTKNGKLLGLLCGNKVITKSFVAFESMWLKFRSSSSGGTNKGFKINWNYVHVNQLKPTDVENKGVFESPPVMSARYDEEQFSWQILTEREIQVKIDFEIYNKGLNLYDGYDDSGLKIDIQKSPWTFTSSSNVLYISTVNADLSYFKIKWVLVNKTSIINSSVNVSDCSRNMTISSLGTVLLKSPGYPYGYKNNLHCVWFIFPESETEHITLQLLEVKLEAYDNCFADYLQLFSSSNLIDWREEIKICNSSGIDKFEPGHTVIHGTPYLKVELVTDGFMNRTGFEAVIDSLCGSNMTGSFGFINGYNFWNLHHNLTKCHWQITVRQGKRISLRFDFDKNTIPLNNQCENYVLIHDGINDESPILSPGRICQQGNYSSITLESQSNVIDVKYFIHSKKEFSLFHQKTLWNLTYHEIGDCIEEIRLSQNMRSVNISTPGYPDVPNPHTECIWTIVGPVREILEANFVDRFDLNAGYCQKEFVEFFDGSTKLSTKLGHFCKKPNQPIRSTGNVLFVYYQTEIAEPRNGFRVNISIANCGGTYQDLNGEITSEKYPNLVGYPKFTTCNYIIKLPQSTIIVLTFLDLHLPFSDRDPNTTDHLILHPIGNTLMVDKIIYGDKNVNETFVFDTNELLISFKTFKKTGKYRGFKIKYRSDVGDCSRFINNESGLIVLKPIFMSCHWKIMVPKGQKVRLEFEEIIFDANITKRFQPISDSKWGNKVEFKFYNDFTEYSKISEFTLENYQDNKIIISSDNIMVARIKVGINSPLIHKIQARYTSDEISLCPSDIDNSITGNVNFNDLTTGNNNFYCKINFNSLERETITFKILKLSMIIRPTFLLNSLRNLKAPILFRENNRYDPFKIIDYNVTNELVSYAIDRGSVSVMQSEKIRIAHFTFSYTRQSCGGVYATYNGLLISTPNIQTDTFSLECVWLLKDSYVNNHFQIVGNVSFSDSCFNEYIAIYGIFNSVKEELIRICDKVGPIQIQFKRKTNLILYHSQNFQPKQNFFDFKVESHINCGSKTLVTRLKQLLTVNATMYKNNIECIWEFETVSGYYITVNFIGRFFLEDSLNCRKDSLQLQRLEGDIWFSEAKFCGRNVPTSYKINSNRMRIIFQTDDEITGDGFQLAVFGNCFIHLNVTNQKKTITTPSTKNFYSNRINCEYIFKSKNNQSIGVNIKLQNSKALFEHILLINLDSSCRYGGFKIYKSEKSTENPIKTCNEIKVNNNNYLRISYESSYERSFIIEYAINDCKDAEIINPTSIHSLRDESNSAYTNNMNCSWKIYAPKDHSIVIDFHYFSVEKSYQCALDYVSIYTYDGFRNKLIAKLCGNMTEESKRYFIVDSNTAIVEAVSDANINGVGFEADILFTRNCNENVMLSNITAPITLQRSYQLNNNEDLYCQFNILAPSGYRVILTLLKLDLNATVCQSTIRKCNYFELRNSIGVNQQILAKYYSNFNMHNVTLSSSYEDVLMTFVALRPGKYMFEMILNLEESICGSVKEFTLTSKINKSIVLKLPNNNDTNYKPNIRCHWRITFENSIKINFNKFLLQNISIITGQCTDFLNIKFHSAESRFFCGNATGISFKSSGFEMSSVDLSFNSDETIEDKGFEIIITQSKDCNETFTKLNDFVNRNIEYFSYEGPICQNAIRVPENYTINIYILYNFFLSTECTNQSNWKIYDLNTNKTLYNICERISYEKKYFTKTNAIMVHAPWRLFSKFYYYTTLKPLAPGCGSFVNDREGYIVSPTYNDNRLFSHCRWDIEVTASNIIVLSFVDFNMGSLINCNLDYVQILTVDIDGTENLINSFCGPTAATEEIKTKGNRVAIVSSKSPNFDGTGWIVLFRETNLRNVRNDEHFISIKN